LFTQGLYQLPYIPAFSFFRGSRYISIVFYKKGGPEMKDGQHSLHAPASETTLQWIAIGCMALGLIISTYYNAYTLKTERIEGELTSYLHLNDRYHKLLFTLMDHDSQIFKTHDDFAFLQKNKYIIYELFELFATVDLLENYFTELDEDVWPCWKRRMEFLFSKPAIRHAWQCHANYAGKIYKQEFVQRVENVIASITPLEGVQ
jgi:hypothetical protein